MPSSVVFTGASFSVESVAQIALATVRVRFTQDPLAVSSVGAADALNPANYVLAGPTGNQIVNCGSVYGDPQAIDLFLAAPLTAGTWTLTVSALVETTNSSTITAPRSMSFVTTIYASTEGVNPGAEDDDAESILRKHLNPSLKGKGWDSTIAAIASGLARDWKNGASAFDQLFKVSASGLYLARKAADDGLSKPSNVGMPDDLFRQYAIRTTNDKLTEGSLLRILEIFYGPEAVRAASISASVEPYALQEGDDLNILIDEEQVIRVAFTHEDFGLTGDIKAIEVAAAITRACRLAESDAFAIPFVDPQSGQNKVRIYSGALGLSSSVRITGGKAQNVLQFSDVLALVIAPLPEWTITVNAVTGTVRFTNTSHTSSVDLSGLYIGDYVNVYGTGFLPGNIGSFTVTNVYYAFPGGTKTQWFEIDNTLGAAQVITQTALSDLMFFRPTRKSIHTSKERGVIVSQPGEEVDVVLPATSQAVGRRPGIAAYNQCNAAKSITSVQRAGHAAVFTCAGHGFAIGDQVLVENAWGAGAGLNQAFKVDSVTTNTFTVTTGHSMTLAPATVTGLVTPFKAAASTIPGPYMWDPKGGVSVTSTQATLAVQLDKDRQYTSVTVDDATQFPDAEGWLVFDFGYETQVAPVRYYGRLSNTELDIDFSFKFPNSVAAGANVTLLAGRGPFVPEPAVAIKVGSFYLTDSQAGRIAASKAIDAAIAAGVIVNKTVVYPGDRGLGGEGYPQSGYYKIADKVSVWGSDDQDGDIATARSTS